MTINRHGCQVLVSKENESVFIKYNNLTLPAIKGFTQPQIVTMLSICDSKDQMLAILNAVTKN